MCKFSIIVVCKNEHKYICKTINSILNQKYQNYECIVMDGNSTDGTMDILKELAKEDDRIRIYSESDSGIYDAMNKAIKIAKGEYIYFLNVRDYFYDAKVLNNINTIIEREKADIIIGRVAKFNRIETVLTNSITKEYFYKNIQESMCVCHQGIFSHRTCLEDGFNLEYSISSDYDWLCSQVKKKRKIHFDSIKIATYSANGFSSLGKNREVLQKETDRIREKYFDALIDLDEQNKQIRRNVSVIRDRLIYDWLYLKQRNGSLVKILQDYKIKSLAIYGYSVLGKLLYSELENTEIDVKYIIDRGNFDNYILPVPIYSPDCELDYVDAVVITPLKEFKEIKKRMQEKLKCRTLSIEDILNEAFDTYNL